MTTRQTCSEIIFDLQLVETFLKFSLIHVSTRHGSTSLLSSLVLQRFLALPTFRIPLWTQTLFVAFFATAPEYQPFHEYKPRCNQ